MKIKFCGAAEGVTGSCHLVTVGEGEGALQFLLDCGMFQGGSSIEAHNEEPFPFDPEAVSFVLLSHAHIDHSGRLPLLYKRGFRGKIYCTDSTSDLIGVMLRDAAYIQEKEAEWKSRKAERAGRPPVEPLYTIPDAEDVLKLVSPVMYSQLVEPAPGVKFVMNDAGHIFGSAIIEVWTPEGEGSRKTVFSGDLGRGDKPMLNDPTLIKKADTVIMESTYGNRLHDKSDNVDKLVKIILETTKRGGNVVIPSFAVGRTQELIYELNKYFEDDPAFKAAMKNVSVYIDSPMATAATEVFRKNAQAFDEEFKKRVLRGDDPLDFDNLHFTKSTAESAALNEDNRPKIIISASGMCEAGRIRHHLKHNLWRHNSSIVFVGYQGEGTLGRRLLEGAESVKLFGEEIAVNAQIHNLEGFSGHADRDELLRWVKGFEVKPEALFIVHGENQAKHDFAATVEEATGIKPIVIEDVCEYEPEGARTQDEQQVLSDIMDAESLEKLKARISTIKGSLEDLLYKAEMAATAENDPAALADLNDKLLALEKDTIGLAGSVTER
ncbi:MAG: MBL fold metallo-hydrolase [Clostridiales Family XIII bacterium]|nr:MBL fold metallo-hydrolase [Clostridiales Family XIII bacterium]